LKLTSKNFYWTFFYSFFCVITSKNEFLGVVRNKAFFSISLLTKEYKVYEILDLDNNDNFIFYNSLNKKNQKIEVEISKNNNKTKSKSFEKKLFYYLIEDNYSDYLKFFTRNLTKQENKFDLYANDEKLPRIYFINVLKGCFNCFLFYLSKKKMNYIESWIMSLMKKRIYFWSIYKRIKFWSLFLILKERNYFSNVKNYKNLGFS